RPAVDADGRQERVGAGLEALAGGVDARGGVGEIVAVGQRLLDERVERLVAEGLPPRQIGEGGRLGAILAAVGRGHRRRRPVVMRPDGAAGRRGHEHAGGPHGGGPHGGGPHGGGSAACDGAVDGDDGPPRDGDDGPLGAGSARRVRRRLPQRTTRSTIANSVGTRKMPNSVATMSPTTTALPSSRRDTPPAPLATTS